MIIAATILIFIWAILSNSWDTQHADVEFVLYSRKHREFVWGISQTEHYMPDKIICSKLSVGIGFAWMSLNFYRFP